MSTYTSEMARKFRKVSTTMVQYCEQKKPTDFYIMRMAEDENPFVLFENVTVVFRSTSFTKCYQVLESRLQARNLFVAVRDNNRKFFENEKTSLSEEQGLEMMQENGESKNPPSAMDNT